MEREDRVPIVRDLVLCLCAEALRAPQLARVLPALEPPVPQCVERQVALHHALVVQEGEGQLAHGLVGQAVGPEFEPAETFVPRQAEVQRLKRKIPWGVEGEGERWGRGRGLQLRTCMPRLRDTVVMGHGG